ncbi:universal stress protein [Candidatus Nitrososphaera evergladensis]|nr:universal stress protein [Candidatus Nitrososphaera evergladensis]
METKKNEIQRILVPIDGSEPAFDAASLAITIARRFDGAQLYLLHVVHIDQILRALGIHSTSESYSKVVDEQVTKARKEADKWFERISKEAEAQEGMKITNIDVKGTSLSIAGEIVDYAEKNNIDLIVIGTRGLGGFTKLLMGSVATGVVNYAPCSVLTVR